jgi:hypothetical protein
MLGTGVVAVSTQSLAQAIDSEPQEKDKSWRRLVILGAFVLVGVGAILLYAWSAQEVLVILGAGILFSVAALAAGVFLGFLFGVPRTLAAEGKGPTEATPFSSISANTNLEQISDWLTKILVGVTLVQLPAIRDGAVRLFDALGPALGDQPESPAVAGGILTYFSVLGFLSGWLATRLFLGRLMSRADQATLIWARAEKKEEEGDFKGAQMLRQEALQVAESPGITLGNDYTATRAAMSRGQERTAALERIVSEARKQAASAPAAESMRSEEIEETWAEADEGQRVVLLGMMQGRPDQASYSAMMDALTSSMSAFEQYHALELARRMLPQLSPEQRTELELAIERQTSRGGWIEPGTDRWMLAERIRKELRAE